MASKKLFSAVLATLVLLSIIGPTVAFAQTQTSTATTKPIEKLPQILANNTNLSNFTSLLKKANLTNTLSVGNYTIFAPDNTAFSKVDASTLAGWQNNTTALRNVLWYHIVPKKLVSSDFVGTGTLKTTNQLSLPYSVSGTTLKIDDATVTKADINANNGVIHVIDKVMIPPTETASATAGGGFLGLPGFEALYAVAGLLVVAFFVIRRRK